MRLKKFVEKIKYITDFCGEKLKWSPWYWRTLLLFFVVAFVVKIVIVYFSNKHLDYFNACLSYIASDIIILFLVQLLITINWWIKIRQLRLFNDIIVFVLLVVYCVDIFIIFFFQSRASVSDAFTLWGSWSVGFAWAVRIRILVFLIVGCVSFFLVQSKKDDFQTSQNKEYNKTLKHKEDKTVDVLNTSITPFNAEREISFH